MVLDIALAAASGGAAGAFGYNRQNFLFDKEVSQKRDFQDQEMRIKQYELYREDVRDLVALTVRKMDNYLIVNTIQLGFCLTLLTEGRPRPSEHGFYRSPGWLIGLYALSTCGALLYYLLSMWLAMHASIAAHSVGVRMLTQHVRLPIPTAQQLDAATAGARDFEGGRLQDVFRIPLLRRQLRMLNEAMAGPIDSESASGLPSFSSGFSSVAAGAGAGARTATCSFGGAGASAASTVDDAASDAGSESGDPGRISVTSLQHFRLFRQLQTKWQAYDAYARVCMAMGTNQVIHAMVYEVLILLMAENDLIVPTILSVGILSACAWILTKLDLYQLKLPLSAALQLLLPPTIASVSMFLLREHTLGVFLRRSYKVAVPLVYGIHTIYLVQSTRLALPGDCGEVRVPDTFRGVLYLDPFFNSGGGSDDQGLRPTPAKLAELRQDVERWTSEAVQAQIRDSAAFVAVREAVELLDKLRCELLARGFDDFPPAAPGEAAEGAESPSAAHFGEDSPGIEGRWWQPLPAAPESLQPKVWLELDGWDEGNPIHYYYCCDTEQKRMEVPGQDRISRAAALRDELADRVARAECLRTGAPGRLPWQTVKLGRRALIFAWVTGLAWSIASVTAGVELKWRDSHHGRDAAAVLRAAVVPGFGGPVTGVHGWAAVYLSADLLPESGDAPSSAVWPVPFLRPMGIACHDALGPIALIAGKYSVHAVPLELPEATAPPPAWNVEHIQAAINGCLASAAEFQLGGLAGVSVECSAAPHTQDRGLGGGGCAAILLAASGRRALRCPLGDSDAAGTDAPTAAVLPPPKELNLLGGPWHAVAVEQAGALWVVGGASADGANAHAARLQPVVDDDSFDAVRSLAPELDIDIGEVAFAAVASVLPPRSGDGRGPELFTVASAAPAAAAAEADAYDLLRAWPIAGGPPRMWRLPQPLQGDVRRWTWTGICTKSPAEVYLAGVAVDAVMPDAMSAASAGALGADGVAGQRSTVAPSFGVFRTSLPPSQSMGSW